MQTACPLVAETELPGARDFTLDRKIRLLCVAVDEVLRKRKRKGKNGERESRLQVRLIGKEGTTGERIEALVIGKVKHVQEWGRIQDALKDGRAIEVSGRVQAVATNWSDKPASGGRAARGKQLGRTPTIGRSGVESRGQKGVIIEQTITSANHGFSIACGVPSQAKARREIVIVARDSFHDTEGFLRLGIDSREG